MGKWWAGTPNYNGGNYGRMYLFPHWTAGSFEGSVATLQNPARQASAHYVIEDDNVAQLVDESNTAWHCGNGYYNWRSISYELVGWPGHPPTQATLDTCAAMMAQASRDYFGGAKLVLGENVLLHKMVYATSCPGDTDIPYLIEKANKILKGEPDVWEGPGVEISGANRAQTANRIADYKGWTGALMSTNGDGWSDPLTGMWVAGTLNANIVYDTNDFYISDGTGGIYLGSDNRFGTNRYNLEVWEKVMNKDIGKKAFAVPANTFADGISCAWVSYNEKAPILLYEDHKNFHYLASKFDEVISIGGGIPKFSEETRRIAGTNRGATAALIAEEYGETWGQPVICTGEGYADALAAASWIGNDVLLLAGWDATLEALRKHRGEIDNMYFIGGKQTIPFAQRWDCIEAAGLGTRP